MEENKKYRFGEIEELTREIDDSEIAADIVEMEEDLQVVTEGWYIHIPSLNISLRAGVVCVPDEETGEYLPEYDVTVLYEEGLKADEWICYEKVGMLISLGSWLNGRLSMDEIMDLECYFVISN